MKHIKEGLGVRKILFLLVVAGLPWGGVPVGLADPPSPRLALARPAPDFTLALFSGEEVRLADFRGKVVVLNFWHSG
jgi:cytochrome oxidase Cu insertion factor (SCO1/SenC/PrrC family)